MNTISIFYTSLPDNFTTFSRLTLCALYFTHTCFCVLVCDREFASARASPLLRRYPLSMARVRSVRRLLPRELAHACLLCRARTISPHVFFVYARPRVRSTRRPLPLPLTRARAFFVSHGLSRSASSLSTLAACSCCRRAATFHATQLDPFARRTVSRNGFPPAKHRPEGKNPKYTGTCT